jgi:hypothetical protein
MTRRRPSGSCPDGRRSAAWVVLVVTLALAGCGAGTDQSGWEMARKKGPSELPEAFPEIPVVLPGTALPSVAPAPTQATPMRAVLDKSLDEGSLFRRGYSAPTP